MAPQGHRDVPSGMSVSRHTSQVQSWICRSDLLIGNASSPISARYTSVRGYILPGHLQQTTMGMNICVFSFYYLLFLLFISPARPCYDLALESTRYMLFLLKVMLDRQRVCLHMNKRNWGNKWGKGCTCIDYGIELSQPIYSRLWE